MRTDSLDFRLELGLGASAGTLEDEVLEVVGGTVGVFIVATGAGFDPDTNSGGLGRGDGLGSNGDAVGERSGLGSNEFGLEVGHGGQTAAGRGGTHLDGRHAR